MTFYEREINRIRATVYANRGQLDTVIGIRRHINDHFDTGLSLDALSHAGFISKYHLLRLFKKYYGQTPKQYLRDKRIEQSKLCLEKGMSVAETCYAIGWESPCSFSTLFRKKTGCSPTTFQKEQFSQYRFNHKGEALQHQI
ncbi:helix-turn-helix domain-containing protein [Taibaiella koreensis]|uniref:helix-turn-helix domain-containing protein n=1 Tax=Taibaiella koreensis TaxID=1268548 RepID=UPI000E59F207|nr:AraC family transcriptional regulator [Taibaiella koreensis]